MRERWRCRSHGCWPAPYAEVRHLGALLKDAARDAAYNVQSESLRALVEGDQDGQPELGAKASNNFCVQTRMAPTWSSTECQ